MFSGVSFRLSAGGLMVVRGPNGSGKSSLLRILGGLMKPSTGKVACDLGQGAIEPEELARNVHLIGHRGAITDALTTVENLRFQTAVLGGAPEGVAAALARLGLSAIANQRAHTLSAGQRRRLALARLITAPRPIWLLDEPSESLDTAGEALAQSLIAERRASGGIVVVATHAPMPATASIELTLVPAISAIAA